jgi:hypothetical protein
VSGEEAEVPKVKARLGGYVQRNVRRPEFDHLKEMLFLGPTFGQDMRKSWKLFYDMHCLEEQYLCVFPYDKYVR